MPVSNLCSVWKPLRGPIRDWPLAICDATTVQPERDFAATDFIFDKQQRENIMVHFNKDQRWVYLSDQMPSELLLFRQADSLGRPGKYPMFVIRILFLRSHKLQDSHNS